MDLTLLCLHFGDPCRPVEGWEEANPRDLESHWVSWPTLASPSVPPIVSPGGETWEAAI